MGSDSNMTTPSPEDDERKKSGATGLAIPGGLLIGMGVGFLIDDLPAGMFIGLGAGFIVMMIARMIVGEW